MAYEDEPALFDRNLYRAIWDFVHDNDAKAHRDRQQALLRVHEQGWKLVAGALEKGLGQIADAIRSRR